MTPERSSRIAALLTYCTNVHPAETLDEVEAALAGDVQAVADRTRRWCERSGRFPVGLRLSAAACAALQEPQRRAGFLARLEGFEVFTLNGFPYGAFHGQPVKEQVYLPDWTSAARVTYTQQLCALLAELLPPGHYGSVSTVPGQWKAHRGEHSHRNITWQLLDVAAQLVHIEREQGKELMLALEPEPGCLLETSAETVDFFEQLFSAEALSGWAKDLGVSTAEAERLARRHLGVCLDTCHAAVEFESSLHVLRQYRGHGIRVGKVQISAGLEYQPSKHDPAQLRAFDEPVYLHQVVQQRGGQLRRFDDLPLAFASSASEVPTPDERWRVHFHVPLFTDQYGQFSSTRADTAELLKALGEQDELPHLEVETYTWGVLPQRFVDRPLAQAIDAELLWAYTALCGEDPA